MKKITQKEAIFYKLYLERKKDQEQFTPIWQLIGEIFVKELEAWGFVSYEVSARMSEIVSKNPKLFERKYVTGRTGAKYYAYRIALNVVPEFIFERDLKVFYYKIKQ